MPTSESRPQWADSVYATAKQEEQRHHLRAHPLWDTPRVRRATSYAIRNTGHLPYSEALRRYYAAGERAILRQAGENPTRAMRIAHQVGRQP